MIGIGFLIVGLVCGIYGIMYYRQHGFLWESEAKKKVEIETETDEVNNSLYDITADSGYGGISALVVGALFLVLGTVLLITSIIGPKDINIDGMDISFPCTYLDIQAMGFDIEEGQEIEELKGTTSAYNRHGKTYTVVDANGRKFKIRFENDEEETRLATSCKIYEMSFEYAPPNNIYDEMSGYGYLYSSWQDLEMTPEEREEAIAIYNNMVEEKKEYYDNYEILNSPKITLNNDVDSDMTRQEVEAIMGNGKSPSVVTYSSDYYATREYYLSTGEKRSMVTITYVTKDEIAKITISQ